MLYHVTTADALPSILQNGLLPGIGPRSAKLGEAIPAIYAFASLEAVEDALCGWLGDELPEGAEAVVIEIDMDAPCGQPGFEVVLREVVPPSLIVRVLDECLRDRTDLAMRLRGP